MELLKRAYYSIRALFYDVANFSSVIDLDKAHEDFYCNLEPTEADMRRTRERFDRQVAKRKKARDLASSVS